MRPSWLAKLFSREKKTDTLPPRSTHPAFQRARGTPQPEPDLIVPRRLRSPPPPAPSPNASAPPHSTSREQHAELDSASVTVEPSRVSIEPPPVTTPKAPPRPIAPNEELVETRRMAPQEELSLEVSSGLGKLSTLLASIDEKLVAQHRATELVAERLQALPRVLEGLVETERMSLKTLDELRGAMDRQGQASAQTAERLGQLPPLVEGLGARVEKQTEAATSVKTSVEFVGQSVRGLVDGAQRANNSLVTEFRRGQDEQRQRLEELVERQRKALWVVAGLCAIVVVALIVVLSRVVK